ncbi:MAG TPA: c-type cytochrome [Thermoleophilaceae bacterium]|nr:c-type cytochrome [Thermoleophilaceae bacterium]
MNAREREQYLREYSVLKNQGKPFLYSVAKDSVMACITLGVIILMAILFGAELGEKADPTTTTYTPRPEWYFFFLFELLRVVKPPELVFMATVGIPTICLVLLLLLPFFDRGPERNPLRRPIAVTAGIATIAAMAYLTILGALAGSPTEIDLDVPPSQQRGAEVMASSGCLACHKVGDNGGALGPELTNIGDTLGKDAIARTLVNPTSPMPSYRSFQQENPREFDELVNFVASLRSQD